MADFEVLRDVAMAIIFRVFYIRGAHWRHLANTTEPSTCGGDAVLCQITLTTCYYHISESKMHSKKAKRWWGKGKCVRGW